jgi:A/G-specific adenine glycosylase
MAVFCAIFRAIMGEKFGRTLIAWYKVNKRDLPWRQTRDPYQIWLSEIILQQTQVAQGLSYYNKFIYLFPTVSHLANAPEDDVLKAWQGLGYYSRARNLHFSAKQIVNEHGGKFPTTYQELLSLKGVGSYTASAIASFAYGLPYAVLDGNVFRVLSRVFGIDEPIDSGKGKKLFSELASSLLDKKNPAIYNQGLMEFGALHCRPVSPSCANCVFSDRCQAFLTRKVDALPVKSKRIKVRERHFNYFVIGDDQGKVLINKRKEGDIWQGLYEFKLFETDGRTPRSKLFSNKDVRKNCGKDFELKYVSEPYVHVLTHQRLRSTFYVIKTKDKLPDSAPAAPLSDLDRYAFPRLITRFLEDCDLEEMF